jgi:hypothetical protein
MVNLLVVSVSSQTKIINFNNYSNYISRFNFIQYKNYYWKHKMQTLHAHDCKIIHQNILYEIK